MCACSLYKKPNWNHIFIQKVKMENGLDNISKIQLLRSQKLFTLWYFIPLSDANNVYSIEIGPIDDAMTRYMVDDGGSLIRD